MLKAKPILPILLILLTNAFALLGVSQNRSGEPEASLVLTQRELPLIFRDFEDSGVFLDLNWGSAHRDDEEYEMYSGKYFGTDKLNQEKAKELGVDCPIEIPSRETPCYQRFSSIQAYIVLEFEGMSWENWLIKNQEKLIEKQKEIDSETDVKEKRKLEKERLRIKNTALVKSRLFTIDAGMNPVTLRRQYPDRSRYIITPGLIRLTYLRKKNKNSLNQKGFLKLHMYINKVLIEKIYVSKDFGNLILKQTGRKSYFFNGWGYNNLEKVTPDTKPFYQVVLNYGSRYEPWIESVGPYVEDPATN